MADDSFKMHPDKMIDPEHYPADNPPAIPDWAINLSFPISSEDLSDHLGGQEIKTENGETKSLRDILADYPHKKFYTMNELMSTVYGHSATESAYNIRSRQGHQIREP